MKVPARLLIYVAFVSACMSLACSQNVPTATTLVTTVPATGTDVAMPPTSIPASQQSSIPSPTEETASEKELLAFPGAEGFGRTSVGGRGGTVIEVTTLADSGPGSLRAAIEAEGPRIIVFRVSGTITLRSALEIRNPYVTIAGQTAPGDGITLRNDPENKRATLAIRETHDVVIRHIRIRSGPSREKTCCLRGLSILDSRRVIVDHVSISWATDANLAVRRSQDVTVQWSIISEPLHHSTHEKGPHGFGAEVAGPGTDRVSLHHNLLAHIDQRAPRLGAGLVDIRNNVIYNVRGWPTVATNGEEPVTRFNYIGNYVKPGPNGPNRDPIAFLERGKGILGMGGFAADNVVNSRLRGAVRLTDLQRLADAPYEVAPVTTDSATTAYERVLANAGATRPVRDPVDARIIAEVSAGTGRIINDPGEVGGWPEMKPGVAPADTDHDGMPDAWEQAHGFDPTNPSDGPQDADGNGYTNIEEYLNAIDP